MRIGLGGAAFRDQARWRHLNRERWIVAGAIHHGHAGGDNFRDSSDAKHPPCCSQGATKRGTGDGGGLLHACPTVDFARRSVNEGKGEKCEMENTACEMMEFDRANAEGLVAFPRCG